jgi:DNA-binding transcriptional LysR family regulator
MPCSWVSRNVTAYEDTVDGRPVRVISLPDTFEPRPGLTLSYHRAELYIDPALNRFIGSGTLKTGRSPDLPQ